MTDEELRSKVKDIINQHVADCLEAAGVPALIPRHPGPVADAIIPIVAEWQRERDARNKEIMKKLRQYPDAGLTEPVREIDAHSSLHTLATTIRKGDA